MLINVVYEDSHILIAEKPPNVPSQPDPTNTIDMVALVRRYLQNKTGTKDPYVGLHHRLDRHVGGLLAFGKTKLGNKLISQQIQNRDIKKQYLVVVCGQPQEFHGTLENYLKKIGSRNQSQVVSPSAHGAKKATLHYALLETIENPKTGPLSLLKIQLETGRHHQIRVQLAYAGIPVLGDLKYNKKRIPGLSKTPLTLWAFALELKNHENETLHLECLPHDHPGFESFTWIHKK